MFKHNVEGQFRSNICQRQWQCRWCKIVLLWIWIFLEIFLNREFSPEFIISSLSLYLCRSNEKYGKQFKFNPIFISFSFLPVFEGNQWALETNTSHVLPGGLDAFHISIDGPQTEPCVHLKSPQVLPGGLGAINVKKVRAPLSYTISHITILLLLCKFKD